MPSFRFRLRDCAVLLLLLFASCSPTDVQQRGSARSGDDKVQALDEAALPLERQEYIWDIEHVAFELEKKFGRALGAALRQRDSAALQGFCRPGFVASLPSDWQTRHDLGYIRQVGLDVEGEGAPADATQFVDYLLKRFAAFSEIGNFSCRVLDLHADDRKPETGRWRVTLYLNATGKDSQGTFTELSSKHQLRCSFVTDQEIEAGQILDRWQVRHEELRSCDGPLFEEATAAFGLDRVDIRDNWKIDVASVRQYYTQMAMEDFDRDGFLDLAVASANGRWRLLKSVGGKGFEDVTGQLGLPLWADEEPRSRSVADEAYLATWIDFDNDNFPDLLLGDRLFRNQAGRRFADVTDKSGLVFGHNPRGAVVADYDGDGLLDLYVLYQHPAERDRDASLGWVGDDATGAENHLWRNAGSGRFVNTTEFARAGGGRRQSFAAAWLHANEDHYPDIYVANDFGLNSLLINQGNGRFQDMAEELGVADYATSMGVAAGDVTGDGQPEIYVANMFSKMGRRIIAHVSAEDYPAGVFEQIQGSCAGNRLYSLTQGEKKYRETSEIGGVNQVGWAYAPALADFDADGSLDIYATTGFLSFQRSKPDG